MTVMRFLIKASLKLQSYILILAVVFLVAGFGLLRNVPLDVYPEIDPPLVEVQTEALGLSAQEVESLITVPLEADLLNGVAWLDQIRSQSTAGLSSVMMIFERGTDPIKARQMVQERLTQAHALPNVSKPPTMLQPLSSLNRVMMVGLTSSDLSLIEMGVVARWNIKPRLMGVPGVANVAVWGQRERQLQVQVNPKKLRANGVTLSQVVETTGEALWYSPLSYLESSTPGTAGWIDTPNQRLSIRHELPITSSADLAKVSVVGKPGLLLGDVAKVVEDHQPLIGDAVLEKGDGLLLVIEKFPGANTLEVTRQVEKALEAMRPGLKGIEIDTTIYNSARYLEQAIKNLSIFLFFGLILAAIGLTVIYRQWQRTLVNLVVILVSLLMSIFAYNLMGATFNIMFLGGLAATLLVVIDEAIVNIENYASFGNLKRNINSEQNAFEYVLAAWEKIRNPLTYATLIILLLIVPVFFMQGIPGTFFQPLAASYTLAILITLTVAAILTPSLSLTLSKSLFVNKTSPILSCLERLYDKTFFSCLEKPRRVFVTGIVAVFITIISLPFLKISLLPTFRQTDLLIVWEAVPGTSVTEMKRITEKISQELSAVSGVKKVGAHFGRAITGDKVVGINSAELWLSLDSDRDYSKTIEEISTIVEDYPGVFKEVSTYQPKRLNEVLSQNNSILVVRVYGFDSKVLKDLADKIKRELGEVKGIKEASAEFPRQEPQVEIEVDLAKAQLYRIKPGDVRRQATTLLAGLQVGNLYQEQKVFDVIVWSEPEIRKSLSDITSLMIETPSSQLPLGDLAQVRIVPAPIIINREAVSRFMDLAIKTSEPNTGLIAAEIESRLKKMEFPFEYHAEVLSTSSNNQIMGERILIVTIACLIGIYLLMQALFASWKVAALAYLSIPLALSGGILAILLTGGVLSLGSFIGLLALLALNVRNILVLLNCFQYLQSEEGLRVDKTLVIRGVKERFVPFVVTAIVSILVLLPSLVAGPIAGNEILQPMAFVIIGGLITSMYLCLFVIPSLYLRYGN